MKVRTWTYGKSTAYRTDTEEVRDFLSRLGPAIAWSQTFGYAMFVSSVGCYRYKSTGDTTHVLRPSCGEWTCEEPFRPMTNSNSVTTSMRGSVWLAACHTPFTGTDSEGVSGGVWRRNASHFGFAQTFEGWNFNAVHLDGHVGDSTWREPTVETRWRITSATSGGKVPYGWPYKKAVGQASQNDDGLVDEPVFDEAFDKNL
jgi:hypothetical protein